MNFGVLHVLHHSFTDRIHLQACGRNNFGIRKGKKPSKFGFALPCGNGLRPSQCSGTVWDSGNMGGF